MRTLRTTLGFPMHTSYGQRQDEFARYICFEHTRSIMHCRGSNARIQNSTKIVSTVTTKIQILRIPTAEVIDAVIASNNKDDSDIRAGRSKQIMPSNYTSNTQYTVSTAPTCLSPATERLYEGNNLPARRHKELLRTQVSGYRRPGPVRVGSAATVPSN